MTSVLLLAGWVVLIVALAPSGSTQSAVLAAGAILLTSVVRFTDSKREK
jgi:hypothetical protein